MLCHFATGRYYLRRAAPRISYPTAGGVGASSLMKPHVLCVPSQNGRFADWPQRQSATAGLFGGISNFAPRESTSVKGPSMRSGPFGRMRMVTSDIEIASVIDLNLVHARQPPAKPGVSRVANI